MAAKRGDPRTKGLYKKRRLLVLARDQYTCFYCGSPDANQVDHLVPIAKDNSIANAVDMDGMVAACADCNRRKSSRSVGSFLASTSTPPDCFSPVFAPKMASTDHELPRSRSDQT
jgi:5-methylcytosine-specific restriction endonuclease McrA